MSDIRPSFFACGACELFKRRSKAFWFALWLIAVTGCTNTERTRGPDELTPTEARARINSLLPSNLADRAGWATDIYAAFAALKILPSANNICAVIAVAEQESTLQVNPAVPNLSAVAWREIDARAERLGIPRLVARAPLQLSSPSGQSYSERIDAAKTEKDLSEIFEDFIGMVPMGKRLFAELNPVRTGGPMQVSVAYAEKHARAAPYPYPVIKSIRHEVFTRRGGMYFGIAHLLDYPTSYDTMLYRFADFNAGHYASRNAAFQNAVRIASGMSLALDGDVVSYEGATHSPSETEMAVRSIGASLDLTDAAIRRDLERGDQPDFARTPLYKRIFSIADKAHGRAMPRAMLPRIELHSPKITRHLTTMWFANRVEERYLRCQSRKL